MDNYAITVTYIPFLLISGYVFISELIKFIRYRSSLMLALMALSVIGWSVCMLAVVFVMEDLYVTTFLWNIALAFISLTITTQFFVIYQAFFPGHKLRKWVVLLFFVMPLLNAVFAMSPLSHLIREVEVVSRYPYWVVNNLRGMWFWVHTAHSYVLAIITAVTLIRGHLRRPKLYRLSSYLIAIGMVITLLSNIVTLLNLTPLGLDATALAASIGTLLYHLAITSSDQNLYVRHARNRVFNHMDDCVLVLGEKGHIADFNSSASLYFSSVGIRDLRKTTLQGLLDLLQEKGAEIVDCPETEDGKDILYDNDGFPIVLNLRTYEMVDNKRYLHGSIAFFSNVTQNRALLNRLEKEAGMDPLTGLPNRVAYDGAKGRLDNEEHLPLSVVMCDVNHLKETNDTLGHKYGDMLLQTMSQVLAKACEKGHFVARIGGDEFVLLLPRTDATQAGVMIDKIKGAVESHVDLPFKLSLAMGVATKTTDNLLLEDVIVAADALMYEDKKRAKANA